MKFYDVIAKFEEVTNKYKGSDFSIYFMFNQVGMVIKGLIDTEPGQPLYIYNHEYTYEVLSYVLSTQADFDILVDRFKEEALKQYEITKED